MVRRSRSSQRHSKEKRNKEIEPSPEDKIQQIRLSHDEHPLEKFDLKQNISSTLRTRDSCCRGAFNYVVM